MKRLAQWFALLMIVGTAAAACGDGDSTADCAPGFKRCDGDCVADDDPEFGCASTSCEPCSLSRATGICGPTGECAIGGCELNYGDCNNANADGCETNVSAGDVDNCGGCGVACDAAWPNVAEAICANFNCVIGSCEDGWEDADRQRSNGCESEEGEGGAAGAPGAAGAGGAPESGGAGGAPGTAGAGGA